MAGLLSERAGVIDIGLEGKMLFAAFAAAAAGAVSGSTAVALAAALAVAVSLSWLHGLACVSHRGDQVVSGVALNLIAAGLTVVLGIAWFGQGGQTPPVGPEVRLGPLWPGAAARAGPDRRRGTARPRRPGLRGAGRCAGRVVAAVPHALRPAAARGRRKRQMVDAAGVSVRGLRYAALTLNGALCALAGSWLVLAQNAAFVPHMTAGRGFMALAAMIFGKWHPVGAFWACLLFGFLDAVAIRLQGVRLPGIGELPVPAIQALPYVLTVVLLAGFIGRSWAPAELGRPYVKER